MIYANVAVGQLGRKVTLNPVEIAYAFRSPVMGLSAVATEDLLKEVGNRQIKYGNIVAGPDQGRLGVAEPQHVAQPVGARHGLRESWRAR